MNTAAKLTLCAAAGLALASQVYASVVEFTSAEGYLDGSWITTNANWNGPVTNHVVSTTAVGYNSTTGSVTLADGAWVDAAFAENLKFDSAGDTVTARYRFRYTSTGSMGVPQRGILSVSFVGVETNGMARVGVRRLDSGNLRLWIAGASGGSGGDTSEADAGITGPTDTSDWLELTISLTKNSDSGTDDFIFSATLTNLNTGTELISSTTPGFTPRDNLNLSPNVQAVISSGWEPTLTATTNRIVDRFEVTQSKAPIAVTVIGGLTGNGNFQAEEPQTGNLPYSSVANWVYVNGDDTAQNFTFDTQMNWSPDPGNPKRGGMVYNNRMNANDQGYTVTSSGEVFKVSYVFGQVGGAGNWDGNETNRVFLFTTDGSPVDADLTVANITEVPGAEHQFRIPPIGTPRVYSYTVAETLYTTTAADIGKTFYLCIQFLDPSGPNPLFPRIDLVNMSVLTQGPALTPWEQFMADYGLTNGPAGDQDLDGENNWYEYVLGGDPTNSAVQAVQPSTDGAAGNYVFSIRGDNALNYSIITTDNLVLGPWTTNGPMPVTEFDGALHVKTSPFGAGTQEFMKLIVQ